MKRLIYLTSICITFLAGCSKDNSPEPKDETIAKVASVLNGYFKSQIETLGSVEYEEITFTPYAEPKEIISLFGTFKAYGSAVISHYYNNHQLETGGTYFFTITANSTDSSIYVSFYNYSDDTVIKGEEKREYTPISKTAFKLRDYGSAVERTFEKQ